MGKLRRLFESLGVRLLVLLFVTVGAVLVAYAAVSIRSTKQEYLAFVREEIDRSSGLIKQATHDGMLLNRKEQVQATIERLAQAPDIAAIRVYDKEGVIVMSARQDEIGNHIKLDSDTCRSCHGETKTKDAAVFDRKSLPPVGTGPEVMRQLSVIENSPSCSTGQCHAHPADRRVLGVLDLEMSMAPLDAAVRRSQRQFLWTALILIGLVGVAAAVFIRRVVQRPVYRLYEGTRRIADGDLDTRIEVRGHDELAQLGQAFNQMAADLGAARREVTEWSQKLEDKVIEKTEELSRAQRQVLHMEKMASLGKLSATVAHELNNPISGMLTYARLVRRELKEQPLDDAVREELSRYLVLMEKECSRCGGIVQNLLLFARQSGATMAPVDLNEVVERSLMLVRHHLEISGVRLKSELLEGDSRVVADAGQLQQAMVALLVNGVEAMHGMEPGEAELSVRLLATAAEVRIDVADTGIGISSELLPQIFDPFFSTKEAENGVGLGLAVVYGIVQRHGGRIEVDSAVGRGTTFHVFLPRNAAAIEQGNANRELGAGTPG